MAGRARITHELEQIGAALRDLAPLLSAFADQLEEAGFSREEAVRLSEVALMELMQPPPPRDPPP